MMRRLCLLVLVFGGSSGTAGAAVTSGFAGGVLTVGTSGGDPVTLACTGAGGNVLVNGANPGGGAVACAAVTQIQVNGGVAGETIDLSNVNAAGFSALPTVTIDTGDGADTIQGSAFVDVIIAGPGADTVNGNQGNDIVFLGEGADTAHWDPGDGSDTMEGQGGIDALRFNGSNVSEGITVSPNGGRALVLRDVASITMDTNDVEHIRFNAVGGADTVVVNPLGGTDVTEVTVDLASPLDGNTSDAQIDQVTVNGGAAPDNIGADVSGGTISVVANPATITILHPDTTLDRLQLNGLAGNDAFTVGVALAGRLAFVGVDGGGDSDTLTVPGTAADDAIAASAAPPFVTAAGVPLIDAMAVENLRVEGLGGNDTLSATGNIAALYALTLDGGADDDTLLGGNGPDVLLGGDGVDLIDGNQGADIVFLGEGNDTAHWDPGDGSDTIEGQGGTDELRFNGSNANESIAMSANGARLFFTRDIGAITMDTDGVEHVRLHAAGGADTVQVHPLAGTDVSQVTLDLASPPGSASGDLQVDHIVVHGGPVPDAIDADAAGGVVSIVTGAGAITIAHAEPTLDRLDLNAGAGNDTLTVGVGLAGQLAFIGVDGGADTDTLTVRGSATPDAIVASAATPFVTAAGLPLVHGMTVENLRLEGRGGNDNLSALGNLAAVVALVLDGGTNDDILLGGNGADVLLGGDGADLIDGNQGNDAVQGGAGGDVIQWDPGDGSDVITGQGGGDVLQFNASNASEVIQLSAQGAAVRLTRDVGNIVLDLEEVESFALNALGGTDTLVVDALAGTDATSVLLQLAGTLGGATGDALADSVTYNAGASADTLDIAALAGDVTLTHGAVTLAVRSAEPTLDRLVIDGKGGDDAFLLAPAAAALIGLTLEGGAQASASGDVVAIAGAAGAEAWQIAPAAGRVAVTRSTPSTLALDLDAFEWLQLDLAGGVDTLQTAGLPGTGQILDGGTPDTRPGDALGITGFNGDIFASPINLSGAGPIVHHNFEDTSNPQVFEAFLFGAQEVPRNPSTGTGFGTVTLHPAQDAISIVLDYAGLTGNSTLVHIHGPARRGAVAAPIIDLPVSGLGSGSVVVAPVAVTPAQVADLKRGLWYFNVHSTAPASAAGEIRGQIDGRQFVDGFE